MHQRAMRKARKRALKSKGKTSRGGGVRCFSCGVKGHSGTQCPKSGEWRAWGEAYGPSDTKPRTPCPPATPARAAATSPSKVSTVPLPRLRQQTSVLLVQEAKIRQSKKIYVSPISTSTSRSPLGAGFGSLDRRKWIDVSTGEGDWRMHAQQGTATPPQEESLASSFGRPSYADLKWGQRGATARRHRLNKALAATTASLQRSLQQQTAAGGTLVDWSMAHVAPTEEQTAYLAEYIQHIQVLPSRIKPTIGHVTALVRSAHTPQMTLTILKELRSQGVIFPNIPTLCVEVGRLYQRSYRQRQSLLDGLSAGGELEQLMKSSEEREREEEKEKEKKKERERKKKEKEKENKAKALGTVEESKEEEEVEAGVGADTYGAGRLSVADNPELQALDVDGDGYVDAEELDRGMKDLEKTSEVGEGTGSTQNGEEEAEEKPEEDLYAVTPADVTFIWEYGTGLRTWHILDTLLKKGRRFKDRKHLRKFMKMLGDGML